MAIQATATKGGMTIDAAYIMVMSVRIEKYLRPTLDEQGNFAGNVEATQGTARVVMYASQAEREANLNSHMFSFTVPFDHADGADPVAEAYVAFRAQVGDSAWTFTNMTDV